MSLRDWTVSFRPFTVLRLFSGLVVALAILALPASTALEPPVAATPTSRAHLRALREVDRVLSAKMPDLERARRRELAHTILDESLRAGFDPLFVLAVIDTESKFDYEAVSPTGARGLMQVVPSTWDMEVKRAGHGRLDKFNPVHNVRVGIGYLHRLSESFHRPESLLLAYNQGPGGAADILARRAEPTPEAASYAPKVLTSYRKLLGHVGIEIRDVRRLWRAPHETILRTPVLLAAG